MSFTFFARYATNCHSEQPPGGYSRNNHNTHKKIQKKTFAPNAERRAQPSIRSVVKTKRGATVVKKKNNN